VRLLVHRERDAAVLTVEDTGPGIAEAYKRRVFDRFQRGATPLATSGLGLGLFVAARILEAHGGSIRVESVVGRGARFIVELPLRAGGADPEAR
jgi:signal transduction histidine kinase